MSIAGGRRSKGKCEVFFKQRVKTLAQAMKIPINAIKTAATETDKVFRGREIAIFASEGAARGTPWDALSDSYAAWKKKAYPGRKILQLTGLMRAAYTQRDSPHHVVEYFKVGSWTIRLGVQGPVHWDYHFKGGPVPGRPPRRTALASDRESMLQMRARAANAITPYLLQQVRIIMQSESIRIY